MRSSQIPARDIREGDIVNGRTVLRTDASIPGTVHVWTRPTWVAQHVFNHGDPVWVGRDEEPEPIVPTVEQTPHVTISMTFSLDRALTPDMIQAVIDLGSVMEVQAEDGLYSGGHPDAEDAEFLAHLRTVSGPSITLH